MTKKTFLMLLLLSIVFPGQAMETKLLRFPDSHNGKTVFAYAGDLWTASQGSPRAIRLTTHPGIEAYPKFSPDGKWIAFTGQYDGNWDVYVIPAEGGEPVRLTFHPGNDMVLDWYPDGKSILFRSSRNSFSARFNRLHKVSIHGGFPETLPLPAGELSSFNEDASKIAYNRVSREFRNWKRYLGGKAQDIWIYDFSTNRLKQVTTYAGTDSFPMWRGDKVYFISDRGENRIVNIFKYDTNTEKISQVTRFSEYDVKWPSLGTDSIIFENAGCLYRLDLETEKVEKQTFIVNTDNALYRGGIQKVERYVHNANISPDGKLAVFEARGELFSVPENKGNIRNLTRTPGERESYPAWSPDGRWIAYISDKTGESELYIRPAEGKGPIKQITADGDCYRGYPVWSPDSKKIIFSDAQVNLFYADVHTGKTVQVAHGEYARASNFIYGSWSPDSQWITFAKPDKNKLYSIFLYSLKTNATHRVTSNMTDDREPVFDPDGRYLYFIANRQMNTTWSSFDVMLISTDPSRIVGVTLRGDVPSPFLPGEHNKVPTRVKKNEEKTTDSGLRIDLDNMEERMFNLPIKDGYYVGLTATDKGLFFVSTTATDTSPDAMPSDPRIGTLHFFDMNQKKLTSVTEKVAEYKLAAKMEKILLRKGRSWSIVKAVPNQKPRSLNLAEMKMVVNYPAEWKQIYNEVWRNFRDWFYDPGFHGVDWKKINRKYGKFLPWVKHRDDLNFLINETVAELCSSHTYNGGGDYPRVERINTGLLGCDLVADAKSGLYRIAKIYKGEKWHNGNRGPLAQQGMRISEGDLLHAIDGIEIRYPRNPFKLLVDKAGVEVTLTVSPGSNPGLKRDIIVVPAGSERQLRYTDWVEGNLKYVQEKSGGRIGYIHVPNTMYNGYASLLRGFYAQANSVDGLIIDGRYNSGGLIPEMFIERLDRPALNSWKIRGTTGWRTPAFSFQGQMAYLTNGFAGSGGDAFPYYFQKRKLGPVIGTRTWGGLVGISGNPPLMDNGRIAIPDFAIYDTDGKWTIENHGVDPDIDVDDRPDLVIQGKDPILEKAIETVMKNIEKFGNGRYEPPAEFPKR